MRPDCVPNCDAKALRAGVLLERQGDDLVLIVEDDGVGFPPGNDSSSGPPQGGIGLVSMQERAALLGGTLDIESTAGGGSTLFVRVPLTR